jgi:hypothetical protein
MATQVIIVSSGYADNGYGCSAHNVMDRQFGGGNTQ